MTAKSTRTSADAAPVVRRRWGSLNKDEILRTALRVVDEEGIAALTMRRLADELGASPMALYRHVSTREEIVQGLAGTALAGLRVDAELGGSWDRQLVSIFNAVHLLLLEHPAVIEVLRFQPLTARPALELVEWIFRILREAGFSGADAVAAVAALESYTLGFTLQQGARVGLDPTEHLAHLSALPVEDFPNTVELAGDFGTWASESHFMYGLECLLDGIRRTR